MRFVKNQRITKLYSVNKWIGRRKGYLGEANKDSQLTLTVDTNTNITNDTNNTEDPE